MISLNVAMVSSFIKTFVLTVVATVVMGALFISFSKFIGVVAVSTPVLSSISASFVTNNSAILNFTSSEAGTYYYLIYSTSAPAPPATVVKAQGVAVAKGFGEAFASTNQTEVVGLSELSEYTVYIVVENFDPTLSLVSFVDFITIDETTGSVVRAEAHPTQVNVDAAQVLVSALPAGAEKTELQGRINAVQADVTAIVPVMNLISALPSPSELIVADTAEVEAARSAYDALSVYRQSLITNFESLFFIEAQLAVITNAENSVATAEANPDQTNVNAAQLVVDGLADGTVKTSLQVRLDAVQATVDAENAAASGATMTLISALPSPANLTLNDEDEVVAARTSYFNLSAFQQTLVTNYDTLLVDEAHMLVLTTADDAVTLAETSLLQANVNVAQVLVTEIPDGIMKTAFQVRIDAVQTEINTTKRISSFNFSSPVATGGIFNTAGEVLVVVPAGTNRSALTPTIAITGVSISPNSGVSQDFTSPVTYTVTALDSSVKVYVVTVSELATNQVAPDNSGSVTVNNSTPETVIVSPTQDLTISVADGTINPIINLDALITSGTGTLPGTSIQTSSATIAIPSATVVTSDDTAWDGLFYPPIAVSVTLPNLSTETRTLSTALSIGDPDSSLTFSKGVRLLFADQAGKSIGYFSGSTFVPITSVCSNDTQSVGDALSDNGDCKIDVSGDLIVWTKHLTTFATYTATSTSSSTSSSSGGSSSTGGGSATAPVCTDFSPASTPDLFQVNVDASTAKLFFAPVFGLERYFVSYSTQPNAEEHGVGVILGGLGVQNYTVQYLKPNTTYYFRVRAQNGCMPGEWSNTLRAVTRSVGATSPVVFYRQSLLGNLIAAIRTFTFTALTSNLATTDQSTLAVSPTPEESPETGPQTPLGSIIRNRPLPVSTPSALRSPTATRLPKPSLTPTPSLVPSPSPELVVTRQIQPTLRLNFWQRIIRFFFGE